MFSREAFLLAAACLLFHVAAINEPQVSHSIYYSRADLKAPSLNISLHDSRVSFGYIFISPYFKATYKPDTGPYIFENSGVSLPKWILVDKPNYFNYSQTLIWSGLGAAGGAGVTDVQGLHVCVYQDQDHLCYWQGLQRGMHGSGLGIIMNQHYQIIKTVQSGTATASTDLHEFRLTSEDTALITIYMPRFYGGLWILDSIFQEISLIDNRVLFEWNALDHVDPTESHLPIGSYGLAGDGSSPERSWDYFHINSIDKNKDGDYLISARHVDCISKVSHHGGSIMWRLHGGNSSFHLSDFSFRRQHHARFRQESRNRTVISLFNNDNDGFTLSGGPSIGLVVEIDHLSRVATKVTEYGAPVSGGIIAKGMGSMTYLPDDNMLLSWGTNSAMAEFLVDGTPIWYADIGWESYNYRAYKSHWVGKPLQPPALWSYSKTTHSPIALYVSWNGATEVVKWNFYASSSRDGMYELVGSKPKVGFETTHVYDIFSPWTFVEAIDVNGVSLKNSTHVKTYVPDSSVTASCEILHCFPAHTLSFTDYESGSWAAELSDDNRPTSCAVSVAEGLPFWSWVEIFLEFLGMMTCLIILFSLALRVLARPITYTLLSNNDNSAI